MLALKKNVKEGRKEGRGRDDFFPSATVITSYRQVSLENLVSTHLLCFSEVKQAQEAPSFSSAHASPCPVSANKGYSWDPSGCPCTSRTCILLTLSAICSPIALPLIF